MLNNFIYAKLKSLFEEKLVANEVPQEAIVFIEDTKEIWNHGTYFATPSESSISAEEIENIVASSETIQAVMEQIAGEIVTESNKQDQISDLDVIRQGALLGSTAIQPGTGDGTKYLSDDGNYKEIIIPTKVSELENDCNYVTEDTIENGVYIYDFLTGSFTKPEDWDTANNHDSLGIAIIDDRSSFVFNGETIGGYNNSGGGFQPGGDTVSAGNSDIEIYDAESALEDYDGLGNTLKIIEGAGRDCRSNWGKVGTSASTCYDYIFPNGRNGYLGAAGEFKFIVENADLINSIFELMGISSYNHMTYLGMCITSTMYSKDNFGCCYTMTNWGENGQAQASEDFGMAVGQDTIAFMKLENSDFPESKSIKDKINDLITDKQDLLISGTNIKTINGESILGSGDIVIDGGGTGISVMEFSESSIELQPNKFYKLTTPLTSLNITLAAPTDLSIVNEYLIEFSCQDTTISLPNNLLWHNDEYPVFENGRTYHISIINNFATVLSFTTPN